MKMLIGVDGSADSLEAVRQAAELMVPVKDSVAFYYSPVALRLPATRSSQAQLVEDARTAMAKAVFERAKSELPSDLRAGSETVIGTRHPKHGLLAAADEVGANLIVVGARGNAGLQRLLLGSVSRSVVHASKVPVLVARKRDGLHDKLNVLWAYDAADRGDAITHYLNQLSWPGRTRAHILTVMRPQFAGEIPSWLDETAVDSEIRAWRDQWQREHDAEKQDKQNALKSLCDRSPAAFLKAECHVAEGHPVDQILRRIADQKIDLVVMGAHVGGAVSRLLLGSTSDAVLNQAPCSVLIVREKERP